MIGNSHLVPLQDALREHPGRWPRLDCRFHGFRGDTILDTRISGQRLEPATAAAAAQMRRYGGAEAIDLADCDAIVIVGFGHKLLHTMRIWKEARWHPLPSLSRVADVATMPERLISRRAARAGVSAHLAGLPCWQLATRIRGAVDRPVAMIGHPCLHRDSAERDRARFYGIPRAIALGDGPAIGDLHVAATDHRAQTTGVTFLHQPADTLADDLLTRPEFMAGTIPSPRGPRPDVTHPNARYGAMMLDRLAERLAA